MATPARDMPGLDDKRTVPEDDETESDETDVSGRQLEQQSSAKPTYSQLYYVKENVGMKWKDLARMLGFSDRSDIEVFEYMHRDPRESCMAMLTTWQERTGDEGTTCILKEALYNAGLVDIADDLDIHENSYPRLMTYRAASDNELITQQEKYDKMASKSQKVGIDNLTGENLHEVIKRMVQLELKECLQTNPGLMTQNKGAASTAVNCPSTISVDPWPVDMSSESNIVGDALPRFHVNTHGFQVCIESSGTIARSNDSFNNSLCFSETPVKIREKINLKVIDSQLSDDSLRFGFTSRDPNTMAVDEFPPHSYPTLAKRPRFWVKPLPGSLAHQGCVITFSVEESGDVNFAVDGEDKGLFFSGVDVSKPLWAVVDVHGSAVALQFVDEKAVHKAIDQWIHEGDQVQLRDVQMERPQDMQRGSFDPDMTKAIGEVGIVGRIDSDGDMNVFFPSINKGWCLVPNALRKVKRPDVRAKAIIEGDLVMITKDLERLKTVQQGKNLWKDGMEKSLGKMCRVRRIRVENGNIDVRVTGENWEFSSQVVQKADVQEDTCGQGLHQWKRAFSKVCVKCGECTARGAKCSMKDKPLRSPGSCCGCARKDAGCANCCICMTCAGEESDAEMLMGQLKRLLNPLEDFLENLSELEEDEPNEHGLKMRDEVKVTVDSNTLKTIQEEHGLHWDEDMEKVIGMPGKIVALGKNTAMVRFQNEEREILFTGCLTKISGGTKDEQTILKKGDLVRLMNDEEKLKDLQQRHGGYVEEMQGCLGKTGCVKEVAKRRVQVEFLHTRLLWYNPEALTKVSSDAEQNTVHQFKRGDCVKVAVDPETFKANQVGHGGHKDKKMMETAAVVHYIDLDGDAFICWQNGKRYLINPASLEKVSPEDFMPDDSSELKEGELVKVDADKGKIKHAQKATGTINWDNAFYAAAGKVGQVGSIDPSDNTVTVNINNGTFPLNSALVKRASLADMQEHFGQNLSSDFARGDQVRISVGLEELKSLQDGHGGYKSDMEKVMAETGSVCFIDSEGDIYVRFNLGRLCFNPAALSKETVAEDKLCVGNLVHIESDLEQLKSLQTMEHGGYVEEMAEACGKVGRLLCFISSKKIRVKVLGRAWVFNPNLLRRIGSPRAGTEDWKSATICAPGKHDWSLGRCLLCVVCGECTEDGNLCYVPGRPNKDPGSVAGCGDGQAGCDDCGCCMTCAGENAEDFLKTDEFQNVIKKTIKKTVEELLGRKITVDETKTVSTKHRMSESPAEVKMQWKKMLTLLGDMSQTLDLIRGSKDPDSIVEVINALNQHFVSPWSDRNPVEKKQIADHLANVGIAQVFMEYGSFLSSEAGQNDGADGKLASECLKMLYGVVRNCADKSLELGRAVGRSGLLQMAMGELHRCYSMEESETKHEWVQLLVSLLNNCAKAPENIDYFHDIGAVDLLKRHLDETDMVLKVETLCCLASNVNAEDLDLIQLEAEDAEFFVSKLHEAVGNASHLCQGFENTVWSAIELVKDVLVLARHDGNKHAFVKRGALDALILLMESGNDMEKEYSMLCVQRFAMVDSIKETIVSETRVEAVLRALLTQESQIYAVQAAARKTLKCLGKEYTSS